MITIPARFFFFFNNFFIILFRRNLNSLSEQFPLVFGSKLHRKLRHFWKPPSEPFCSFKFLLNLCGYDSASPPGPLLAHLNDKNYPCFAHALRFKNFLFPFREPRNVFRWFKFFFRAFKTRFTYRNLIFFSKCLSILKKKNKIIGKYKERKKKALRMENGFDISKKKKKKMQ